MPDRDRPPEALNSGTPPLAVTTRVICEQGRWVVMMNLQSWNPADGESPIENDWRRINDFASEAEALVAAEWYERTANRSGRRPTGF